MIVFVLVIWTATTPSQVLDVVVYRSLVLCEAEAAKANWRPRSRKLAAPKSAECFQRTVEGLRDLKQAEVR